MREKAKIVFLDRDGTINTEVNYLHTIEELVFIPKAIEAIRLLNQNGYKVIVVTNQAGVAKGYYEEEDIWKLHDYMQSELKKNNAWVDNFKYCPYHPSGKVKKYIKESEERKPGIGMFLAAEEKYEVEKENSWMIGDAVTDMVAGKKYGISTILVSTGHGKESYQKRGCPYDYFVKDIYEAVELVIRKDKRGKEDVTC